MCCNREREGGRGHFTVFNWLEDAQKSTLSAFHTLASSGQRFEQKAMTKPKTKMENTKKPHQVQVTKSMYFKRLLCR